MGQQNTEIDIESLQKSGRRRGGCLDVFLVLSIIFLFVAVAAVAVGGLMVVKELRSKLETARPSINVEALKQTGDTTDSSYKMQNFVYLEPTSSQLNSITMKWESVPYGQGSSVGSNFIFDPEQSSLKPKRVGTYFIYIDFNLTCTHICPAGLLTVSVGDKLTCEVQLPAVANSTPVSKKCWTVSQISDSVRLVTQMTVPNNGLGAWKLELSGSGFGMFLVD
ncbi:uncharacterized protein LOC127355135 [Dicentrarchus labrax]|uniref:uncharacterized protein LOC127355135 n=1 Tax=Dicentrarchus labrax TaxID=13489 RepID=UPI0021F5D802|nr:uncharacterized protein LOC127355135 [Dicentrarchus labrax]